MIDSVFDVEAASVELPAKFATTEYPPRSVGVNATVAKPDPSVVPTTFVTTSVDEVKVNVTASPATGPAGADVRFRTVLTFSEVPTNPDGGTVKFAREVEALFRVMTTSSVVDEHGALLIVQRKV